MRRALPRLWAISAPGEGAAFAARAAALAAALPGRVGFQVRDRELGGRALVELARAVIAVSRPHGCPVLINERVDVALATGADGAHLPERGLPVVVARELMGPKAMIGTSRHDLAGVRLAAAGGANLVVFGPVWPTPSKPGNAGTGTDALLEACSAPVAVLALGGVDSGERAAAARAAGAYGIAAIRGLATVERALTLAAAVD